MESSKFVKIRCEKCKNEQIIFAKGATTVTCLVCGVELVRSKGGKSNISGRVLEVLE